MKNLNLIAATLLFFFFAFTSCQKESMVDLQSASTTAINNERGLPQEGIHIYNESVTTLATAETMKGKSTSRSRGITSIDCGTYYEGCTQGQGNSLNSTVYPDCIRDLNASFNGEDQIFYLVVPATPDGIYTYDISLTDMSADLDLFLLALDSRGQIMDCKGMSINPDANDETISARDLAPGAYAIVVDAYKAGLASHFTLSVDCHAVPPPPSIDIAYIETTFGTCYYDGYGEWTFVATGSDIAYLYQEIGNQGNSITLKNVTQVGNTTTTSTIYLDLEYLSAAKTDYIDSGEALAIGDTFGTITKIEYEEN